MKLNDLKAASWTLARRAERMNPSVIREILKVTERPGIISFAGGLSLVAASRPALAGRRRRRGRASRLLASSWRAPGSSPSRTTPGCPA